ncbi:MAG: RnfABCDGE type electron transport complex subunit B [bacterium]|nr:RnfABCDGE type electron transport complex subunit B [bacterium]MDY3861608.1 RnfABCDGE type electron transport complex subunit B [Ruminococcus sp.]
MEAILTAVIPVTVIGLICAAVLVAASKIMAVKENEKIPQIREKLPGANCGACGYAGCDGYAKALAEEGAPVNLCVPGGDTVAKELSELLGVEFQDVVEQVAVVHCSGDCNYTDDSVDYQGIKSCAAAKQIYGSKGKCSYGCLGLGDCANACPSKAICIENSIARINTKVCTGCGICTKTCPNGLIELVPDVERVVVTCNNRDKGALTRKACSNGCIGCKKCERVCTASAIKVVDNLARIDYTKCPDCGDFGVCARECTTGCIVTADLSGIHRVKQPVEKK